VPTRKIAAKWPAHVRFGSYANISLCNHHVRLPPKTCCRPEGADTTFVVRHARTVLFAIHAARIERLFAARIDHTLTTMPPPDQKPVMFVRSFASARVSFTSLRGWLMCSHARLDVFFGPFGVLDGSRPLQDFSRIFDVLGLKLAQM
jgi:hypothetical protein